MQNNSLAITTIILLIITACTPIQEQQEIAPLAPEQEIIIQEENETIQENVTNQSIQTIYHSEPGETPKPSWRDGEGIVIFASDGEKGATTFIPEGETLTLPLAGQTTIKVVGVEENQVVLIVNDDQRFVKQDETERFGPLRLHVTEIFYLG